MKSSTTYVQNNQFALLLQGPPKAGKTSFVMANFPKVGIIDLDLNLNGAFRVLSMLKEKGKVPKDKEVFYDNVLTDSAGKPIEAFDQYNRLCELLKEYLKDPKIETVCVDSLTNYVPILFAHILKQSPSKVKLGGESIMEIQHWQPFQTLTARFVMTARQSGKKFIFCCHEEVSKDELSGILQYRINMPSRLQHSFGALFTDCWRLEQVDNNKEYECRLRCLSTVRMPGLGNTIGLPPEVDPSKHPITIK